LLPAEHNARGRPNDFIVRSIPWAVHGLVFHNAEYCVNRIPHCRIFLAMLTDYIREAMRLAHYELMENGRFFATIPGLKGLWAEDATLEACREELLSTLEDWIMIKVRFGDKDFPVLNGIDLNPKPEYAQAD
jgi:hypothetical protein